MKQTIQIPDTDLTLAPLGLGTVGAGVDWDGADADRIFDAFLSCGGNLIDSARAYSDWIPGEIGRSERVLGDWLTRSKKRNQIVLVTKGGHPTYLSPADDLHISRMSPDDMRGDLEKSLRTLRTDVIDIYFYHRDNTAMPVGETIEVMETFRKEGKIRYYGCSNWSASRIREADAYCKNKGYRGFIADQALFHMGVRYMNPLADDTLETIRDDLFTYHKEQPRNLAMPYMSVASGYFHLYLDAGETAVKDSPYHTEGNKAVYDRIKSLCETYHASVSQILLGFFSHQPFTCLPLYGPKTVSQLEDATRSFDLTLSDDDYDV